MKKTYIEPQMVVVMTAQTLLQSISTPRGESEITDSKQILTKDEGDWDELWDEWDE